MGDGAESIYRVCRRIKRSDNCVYNALRSIYHDSGFVGEISALWPDLPLLANLRCGLWYAPSFDGACYFKSTDGHHGNWSFSTTRLNMHVAALAASRCGCIVVDATRKGKRFPDSMSKTVPIWACVINRAVAELRGSEQLWDCSLHLPLWVSDTEKASIEKRVDGWVEDLKETGADLGALVTCLKKPLQPLWISQKSVIWLNQVPEATSWPFTPVILLSASHPTSCPVRMSDGELSWSYIPGAADDEESWARGLTPPLFWKHAHDIIAAGPEVCNNKVSQIVEKDRVQKAFRGLEAAQIRVRAGQAGMTSSRMVMAETAAADADADGIHWIGSTGLAVSSLDAAGCAGHNVSDCVINCCASSPDCVDADSDKLNLQIVGSKHSLKKHLSAAVEFAAGKLEQGNTILISCSDGEDASVCIALAILLSFFQPQGECGYQKGIPQGPISKADVKQGLVYICKFHSDARPSRGNLKQVFHHLSGGGDRLCAV